jgi:hypothetical protein
MKIVTEFGRWPLLICSLLLIGSAVGVDLKVEGAYALATALAVLGAASFGAFIYAEGARHREWWHETITTVLKHDKHEEESE